MTSLERVTAAMHFQPVDKVPLQYYYTPVGYYEHGDKLNDLFATLPGDFEPFSRKAIPVIPKEDFGPDGSYHAFRRDGWGTLWEYRIFGITGMPCEYPLDDWDKFNAYPFPVNTVLSGENLEALRHQIAEQKKVQYCTMGVGSLLELLKQLRSDEDVLCDLAADAPEIHELADKIIAFNLCSVKNAVAAGANCISFGDDYGTERGMLISPTMWRSFFKPRLKLLFQPAVEAGMDIIFHSCGNISPILEDLKEVGATAIWPQLPIYDMEFFAQRCRSIGLAVAIHTDRAQTMTYGTPQMVRDLVKREFDAFRMMEGGSWFYVEADNGFPYENIQALVEAIAQWR